ncbi:MAG TPA: T6SS immunity protein Tdi1 domain-containing protein [Cytophagaceae bacterium]|jgi:hypothetical protein
MASLHDYLVPIEKLNLGQLLETWKWLTGKDKTVIALTKMGDAILKDSNNSLYHLDTGGGEIELKSKNYLDFFEGKLEGEEYELILLPNLVEELKDKGQMLGMYQVYAFIKIPLLGGTYNTDNIYIVDLYEHYSLTGEFHFKLKDLPAGTDVEVIIAE